MTEKYDPSEIIDILGMPLETHYFTDPEEDSPTQPPVRTGLAKQRDWHDMYLTYRELCRTKFNGESHFRKVCYQIGCKAKRLKDILLGRWLIDEKTFHKLNKALKIKPFELKQRQIRIF